MYIYINIKFLSLVRVLHVVSTDSTTEGNISFKPKQCSFNSFRLFSTVGLSMQQ